MSIKNVKNVNKKMSNIVWITKNVKDSLDNEKCQIMYAMISNANANTIKYCMQ